MIPIFPQQKIITYLCNTIARRENWKIQQKQFLILFKKYIKNYYIIATPAYSRNEYYLSIRVYSSKLEKNNYQIINNYTAFPFTSNFYNFFKDNSIDLNLLLTEIVYELL